MRKNQRNVLHKSDEDKSVREKQGNVLHEGNEGQTSEKNPGKRPS
ncbi:hypothetical protein [Heyndrickxia acidicola]|uniref:Uncharacterized protein n=1 Tax=Heyndrickxia acidicola TaxID=209389 RepID=A0ABU6ME46_9BACI|nr:hypothetical protein [Heyndrickxia acidicola]MED1202945.1 hypothetical protein [Heyndrickxia acidicola]